MKDIFIKVITVLLFCWGWGNLQAQEMEENRQEEGLIIDQVVGIVGSKMVKLSDVKKSIENMRNSGMVINSECEALESILISELYALQADEDSIFIGEAEVEAELDARIRYFVEQIGSKDRLEEFYGKSIFAIKEEYRSMIHSAMIARMMEAKITEDVSVTPSDVQRFYHSLHKDSVPLIPTEFSLAVIVKKPVVSKEEKQACKDKLNELRDRIIKGENFSALAGLYSEDPGSRRRGGDMGFGARGEWVSEFESMAFTTKEGEISPVFETQYGFHILEVLEKKGENVHVRHILLRPKASELDLMRAYTELDSVAQLIRKGYYTFEEAVKLFSDEAGRQADGAYLSPITRKPTYSSEEIEPSIYKSIEKLEEGDVSSALPYSDDAGGTCYRLFYVKQKTAPHKANLKDDYDKIYEMALDRAKTDKMKSWLRNKIDNTYIRIMYPYQNCKFNYRWNL